MLREISNTRQIKGEPRRRWFSDEYFDLIVWLDKNGETVGFQLCYDVSRDQRALTWTIESGYTHNRVDDGEDSPGTYKASPVLVADGLFPYKEIAEAFKRESKQIDKIISNLVYEKILHYPLS